MSSDLYHVPASLPCFGESTMFAPTCHVRADVPFLGQRGASGKTAVRPRAYALPGNGTESPATSNAPGKSGATAFCLPLHVSTSIR